MRKDRKLLDKKLTFSVDKKDSSPDFIAQNLRPRGLYPEISIFNDRLIIESSCSSALAIFTQDGFYTSLYVTYDKPSRLSREEIIHDINELRKIVDQKTICALSFPGWWYDYIKTYLGRPIDLLTWKHRTTQFEFFLFPSGWKMLNDPQLKVILIKDKGYFHR